MGQSCFDGYFAPECANCSYWMNTDTECGCAYPFPIDLCPAYKEAEMERKCEAADRCDVARRLNN